jgi:hypothetical protein
MAKKTTSRHEADERKLDKAAEQFVAQMARPCHLPLSPKGWASLREHLRFDLYRGQYVVFRDHWEGEGDDQLLVRREILFHSKSRRKAYQFLEKLPEDVARDVCCFYLD